MTSAVAFVEGGVQDACDDACSICLENFGEEDPATVTVCKHEYHLQCILEWSQRSRECPMCLQPLKLKDPDSQSLLGIGVPEQERVMRYRNGAPPAFFQHSGMGDDDREFRSFASSYGDDSDLEERIMHHLAAAALGRAQRYARREESLRFRPSSGGGHGRQPHFMIVPGPANASSTGVTSAPDNVTRQSSAPTPDLVMVGGPTNPNLADQTSPGAFARSVSEPVHGVQVGESGSPGSLALNRRATMQAGDENQQGASSSELSSETLKSRLAAASSRYRESLTKTTRGFRERLRVRNVTMAEWGARAREMSAGVVRAVENITQSPEKSRDGRNSPTSDSSSGMASQIGSSAADGSGDQESSSSSLGETPTARVSASSRQTSSVEAGKSTLVSVLGKGRSAGEIGYQPQPRSPTGG